MVKFFCDQCSQETARNDLLFVSIIIKGNYNYEADTQFHMKMCHACRHELIKKMQDYLINYIDEEIPKIEIQEIM